MKEALSIALWVGAGGFLGTICRYALFNLVRPYAGGLPLGTLIANVTGCFLMGAVVGLGVGDGLISQQQRLVIATGFLGAFTTMSAFVYDSAALFHRGMTLVGLGYFSLTLLGSVLAFYAGGALVRAV